jgi:hypothetical protein
LQSTQFGGYVFGLHTQFFVAVGTLFVGQLSQLFPLMQVKHSAKQGLHELLIPSSQNPLRHTQFDSTVVSLVAVSHVRQVADEEHVKHL